MTKKDKTNEEDEVFSISSDGPIVNQLLNKKECFVYELTSPQPLSYIYNKLYESSENKTNHLVRFMTGLLTLACEVNGTINTSKSSDKKDVVLRGSLSHDPSTMEYSIIMSVPKEYNSVLQAYFDPDTMRFVKLKK